LRQRYRSGSAPYPWDIVQEATVTVDNLADILRDTDLSRKWHAEGVSQGLAEGLAKGRAAVLLTLLRDKFGHDPRLPGIADRLAELSDDDAVLAIKAASAIDALPHG
jgi:hypothetical protein